MLKTLLRICIIISLILIGKGSREPITNVLSSFSNGVGLVLCRGLFESDGHV